MFNRNERAYVMGLYVNQIHKYSGNENNLYCDLLQLAS